jgi:hypothetical protein
MSEDNPHVPAMELWGYTSGTANLRDDYFEHLLFCGECQGLMNQFMDALDALPPMSSVDPSQAA